MLKMSIHVRFVQSLVKNWMQNTVKQKIENGTKKSKRNSNNILIYWKIAVQLIQLRIFFFFCSSISVIFRFKFFSVMQFYFYCVYVCCASHSFSIQSSLNSHGININWRNKIKNRIFIYLYIVLHTKRYHFHGNTFSVLNLTVNDAFSVVDRDRKSLPCHCILVSNFVLEHSSTPGNCKI